MILPAYTRRGDIGDGDDVELQPVAAGEGAVGGGQEDKAPRPQNRVRLWLTKKAAPDA